MNQKQLLELAIEKAGSKSNLSKLTGLRLAFFYEWEKGVSMKFDVMLSVLDAVDLKLELVEKKQNVPKMENPPPPPKRKNTEIEKNGTIWIAECDCRIVDGLFRRGKDGCKKLKSQHKF